MLSDSSLSACIFHTLSVSCSFLLVKLLYVTPLMTPVLGLSGPASTDSLLSWLSHVDTIPLLSRASGRPRQLVALNLKNAVRAT